MSVETGDIISRIYSNFRGVDFRGEEINITRSPDSLNVWKDYKETESIRTRPGMKIKSNFDSTIYGIFFYKGMMLVHSGTILYKVVNGVKTALYSGLRAAESNGFIFENIWYFKDGKHYLQYDGTTIKEVEGYIPTTSIGRKPSGGGKIYEEVNMLTGLRKNTFVAETGVTKYYLDATNIDKDYIPVVSVLSGGKWETEGGYLDRYVVDFDKGIIEYTETHIAPSEPDTDGQDNVMVTFSKTVPRYRDIIANCNMVQVFDNRVFVSGNKDYPNTIWHCKLDDPTYFGDLSYYHEGTDPADVKGMVAGNNALWVFREPSDANTNVFYHVPTIDTEYGKIYPSSHSSINIGCVGKAINFNDDIVFFSNRGMEGMSGDITTEQATAHRSSLVDAKMLSISNYKNMLLEEWEGYLLVFIDNKVFLADSRTAFTTENHIEYEWFYWELEKKITSTRAYEGVLYLGTEDGGVYTLTDTESAIESYWTTPKDKFKTPHKLKTTNKRGCVVEATGDISVYAKIEDTDFELIGTYENVTDYFVSRIKRKKFKDIQLKFHSKTRFSLETATLECFIGGYIKR